MDNNIQSIVNDAVHHALRQYAEQHQDQTNRLISEAVTETVADVQRAIQSNVDNAVRNAVAQAAQSIRADSEQVTREAVGTIYQQVQETLGEQKQEFANEMETLRNAGVAFRNLHKTVSASIEDIKDAIAQAERAKAESERALEKAEQEKANAEKAIAYLKLRVKVENDWQAAQAEQEAEEKATQKRLLENRERLQERFESLTESVESGLLEAYPALAAEYENMNEELQQEDD